MRVLRCAKPTGIILSLSLLATQLTAGCATPGTRETPRSQRTGEVSVRPGVNKEFKSEDFDIQKWISRFEVESREIVKQRNRIVDATGAEPGMNVADIGAGTGLLTGLLAKRVGPSGKVFAVDIVPDFLEHIRTRAKEENLSNVQTVLCTDDSAELRPNTVDVALICDTYHHFEYPHSTMTSLYEAMKPGGTVVIVDFDRIPGTSRAWVLQHVRAGKETVIKEIEGAGFELTDDGSADEFLEENYVIKFRKPA